MVMRAHHCAEFSQEPACNPPIYPRDSLPAANGWVVGDSNSQNILHGVRAGIRDSAISCSAAQPEQNHQRPSWPTTGRGSSFQPPAPLFDACDPVPTAPPQCEEGSLDHYRNAFIELSRQNFILRRQLSAAEEKLRRFDDAPKDLMQPNGPVAPARSWPDAATSDRTPPAPPASPAGLGRGAPRPKPAGGSGGSASGAEKERRARFWSKAEHERFLEGLELYGSQDAHSIAYHVGTRTVTQVRTHAQKYFLKVGRDGAAAPPAADDA